MRRKAIIFRAVGGRFCRFKRGNRVWVRRTGAGEYFLERRRWRTPLLPLCNQLLLKGDGQTVCWRYE